MMNFILMLFNFSDSTCSTTGAISDGGFTLSTGLDECGTSIVYADDIFVAFSQRVFAHAYTGPIYVGNPIEIDFFCEYDSQSGNMG